MSSLRWRGAWCAAWVLAGCAGFTKERGHDQVSALVAERSGFKTGWETGSPERAELDARVDALLKDGLTRARAVQLGLLNNPALQATYEELGVSQADLLQAGMLSNPTLGLGLGIPLRGPTDLVEVEFSLVQNVLDLFLLPVRKEMAADQFAADTLRVAHEALGVAADAADAFIAAQAARQDVMLKQRTLEAAEAAAELAVLQRAAGNLSELRVATEQAAADDARLMLGTAELHEVEAREALNRLLGLSGGRTKWSLAEDLPEVPAQDPPLGNLERVAVERRLDLMALRKQADLLSNAVSLAKSSALFGTVEVGIAGKHEAGHPFLLGPSLTLELPIFDRRGAMIARLEATHRQAERRLTAATIDARSDVRVARARLVNARDRVEKLKTSLLPLRARIVELSQQHYNGMFVSAYDLLRAKQDQVAAYGEYLASVGGYWQARAALERASGGKP